MDQPPLYERLIAYMQQVARHCTAWIIIQSTVKLIDQNYAIGQEEEEYEITICETGSECYPRRERQSSASHFSGGQSTHIVHMSCAFSMVFPLYHAAPLDKIELLFYY